MFVFLMLLGLLMLVIAVLGFNSGYIPSPIDQQYRTDNAVTQTASFNGAMLDLGLGYAPGGPGQAMSGVVQIVAIDRTTGDETYAFKVQESADGVTWTDVTPAVSRTATGSFSLPGFVSQRFVRVSLAAAGTTPSVTYTTWFVAHQ